MTSGILYGKKNDYCRSMKYPEGAMSKPHSAWRVHMINGFWEFPVNVGILKILFFVFEWNDYGNWVGN